MFASKADVVEIKEKIRSVNKEHNHLHTKLENQSGELKSQQKDLHSLTSDLTAIRKEVQSFTLFSKRVGVVILILLAGGNIPIDKLLATLF